MNQFTGVAAAAACGLVCVPTGLAGLVDANFVGGSLRVSTFATSGDDSDFDSNVTPVEGPRAEGMGSSSSGLVASAGTVTAEIGTATPRNPFTFINFSGGASLSQGTARNENGIASVRIATEGETNGDPFFDPIIFSLGEDAAFNLSVSTPQDLGPNGFFFFEIRRLNDEGSIGDSGILEAGEYEVDFVYFVDLGPNELEREASFSASLFLESLEDPTPIIPLPGPAGLAMAGLGLVALRRRRA